MSDAFYGTYQRLNVSVRASNVDVIRAAIKKIAKHHRRDPAMRQERKKFYKIMLRHHKRARDLFTKCRF